MVNHVEDDDDDDDDERETRQLHQKADTVQVKNYDKSVPSAFGEKKHRGENGTLQCSAGPERHGYMSSRSVPGHQR